MRRENRRKENLNKNINMYYLIGGGVLLFIIIFATTYIIYGNSKNKMSDVIDTQRISQYNNIMEEASTSMGKTVDESKNEINNTTNKIAINTSNITNTNSNTKSKKNEIKSSNNLNNQDNETKETNAEENKEVKEISFIRPVDGDITKEYAKDNLIFSTTLNEWVTHVGIDFRAEKTEVVKASADGIVKTIKNDPRYGLTVTIEHDNGFKTVYANLLTSEFVVEGEKVTQGQSIGTVGNTAVFESSEDSHLHFEMLKDNENIDPNSYLK